MTEAQTTRTHMHTPVQCGRQRLPRRAQALAQPLASIFSMKRHLRR